MNLALALTPLCLIFTGCSGPQSALDPAGSQAGTISQLWWVHFLVTCLVFVLVMLFLILSVRGRHVNTPDIAPMVSPDPTRERRVIFVIRGGGGLTSLLLFAVVVAG